MKKHKLIIFLFLLLLSGTSSAYTSDDGDSGFGDEFPEETDFADPTQVNDMLSQGPLTPENQDALANHLATNPQAIQDVEISNVDNLGEEIVDDHHDHMTTEQIQGMGQNLQELLDPQTIQDLLEQLTQQQLEFLTEEQSQALDNNDVEYVLDTLDENQLEQFIDQLSDEQVIEFVNQNPELASINDALLDRYTQAINPGLNLDASQGTIEDQTVTNNGISLDLTTFAEGVWNLIATEFGFDIMSGSDGNPVQLQNPLNGDIIETTLDSGQSIGMEFLDDSTFVLKLNDEFLNLDIIPEGPSRLKFYSKTTQTTMKVFTSGEYAFNDGILIYENPAYREALDTMSSARVTIDHAVGFVCMLANKDDLYTYDDRVTLDSWSTKIQLHEYKLCVRKDEYIKEEYFQTILEFEEMANNRKISYIDLVTDKMWLGSWIEYYVNNIMSYQSRGRFGTMFNGRNATMTTPTPEKTFVFDNFIIWEEINTRYLRVSHEWFSEFSLDYIGNNDDPELFIDNEKLTQVSPTNVVTAFVPGSEEEQAFVAGLTV